MSKIHSWEDLPHTVQKESTLTSAQPLLGFACFIYTTRCFLMALQDRWSDNEIIRTACEGDTCKSRSPLAELVLMGGTIPNITKCTIRTDEKLPLLSNHPHRSQRKSNLHCQKTPSPQTNKIKTTPCEKSMVWPHQTCGLQGLTTPCGITFPKNKSSFMWGSTG